MTTETYSYCTDDGETVTGFKMDRQKAAAGVGTGFNGRALTGTIASANEQRSETNNGLAEYLTAAAKDTDRTVINAMHMAVVTQALKLNGFDATWTVSTDKGIKIVDPRNAIDDLEAFGNTLEISIDTTASAQATVNAINAVYRTMVKALQNLDSIEGFSGEGTGKDFIVLMAESPVFSMAISKEGSALSELVAAAKTAIVNAELVNSGSVFALDVSDLETCPVCASATHRQDLVCPNGHDSAAAIRAKQEQIVLTAAFNAAAQAGLNLTVNGKAKGAPRLVLCEHTDVATLANIQDISAKVSFNEPIAAGDIESAWSGLSATTVMLTAFTAAIEVHTGGAAIRSRALRAVREALDKAADHAADVIADPIRTEIAHSIVTIERERSAKAWAVAEVEYRKELIAKANIPSRKTMAKFVEDTNSNRRFVDPRRNATSTNGKPRRSGPRPGNSDNRTGSMPNGSAKPGRSRSSRKRSR